MKRFIVQTTETYTYMRRREIFAADADDIETNSMILNGSIVTTREVKRSIELDHVVLADNQEGLPSVPTRSPLRSNA